MAVFTANCTTKQILKEEEGDFADIRQEYEKVVHVKEVKEAKPKTQKAKVKKIKKKNVVKKKVLKKPHKSKKREPGLEDSEGFDGRRPIEDPFRPGESVTLSVKYFNMRAGDATFKVEPFVEVNGKKWGMMLGLNKIFTRWKIEPIPLWILKR